MQKIVINATIEDIHLGVEFVERVLRRPSLKTKDLAKAMLITEEAMVRLIEHAKPGDKLTVGARFGYGVGKIQLRCNGEAFDGNSLSLDLGGANEAFDGDDEYNEEATRSMLLSAFKDNIEYSHKGDNNHVKITVGDREKVFIKRTLVSVALGLAVGMILRLALSPESAHWFADTILLPIQSIYLNSLEMITAPTVFFSLLVATARFNNFSDPGKVSRKIIINYGATTVIAVAIGVLVFNMLSPLMAPFAGLTNSYLHADESYIMSTSILSMLANIIPADIISPFQNTDALQLLVLSILCGAAIGKCGKHSERLNDAAEAFNSFFSAVAGLVSQMVPVATFFTLLLLLCEFRPRSLLAPLFALGASMVGALIMILIYMTYIIIVGRVNPIIFIKKYIPIFRASIFSEANTSQVFDTMKFCQKKLGISKKVSSFSIPFGAIANMDGNCIYLTIAVFLMAFLGGVEMGPAELAKILFMIVVLSLGSPISSGSAMIALTLLMNQMGMSVIVISLLLASNAFVEIVISAFNTLGDVAITLAVARSENLVDVDVYNKLD